MSLCGKCEGGTGLVQLNICSVDDIHYYCVGCLFMVSRWVTPHEVSVDKLDIVWQDIEWDMQFAMTVCEKKLEPHWSRIQKADMNYPILVAKGVDYEKTGKYSVLDGRHRLVKAHLLGKTTIRMQVIPKKHLDRCFIGLAEELLGSRSVDIVLDRDEVSAPRRIPSW